MKPLHYIVFHPDRAREKTLVQAKALVSDTVAEEWQGHIWADKPGGNEDPFVFFERWLYSYCHATQLRRSPRRDDRYISAGSYLFFCSGDAANKGAIRVDTVFVVDRVAHWPRNHHCLPEEFKAHYKDSQSILWDRHFKFPFLGVHEGKYTYVSRQWFDDKRRYSFLPVSKEGDRVQFALASTTPALRAIIQQKVRGKYPVPLDDRQQAELLSLTLAESRIQVIGDLSKMSSRGNDLISRSSRASEANSVCTPRC